MHPVLERMSASLRAAPGRAVPVDGDAPRAAVALAFRTDRGEPELLFIRRAEREDDPWSGQVALPGGRWSPGDASLQATAFRETLEETGLDLGSLGTVLGVLDDLRPLTAILPPIIVTPFVATLVTPTALRLSHEVAGTFWVPWSAITDPALARESEVHTRGATWRTPSFVFGEHVVWGMTERILRQLIGRASSGSG